VTGFPFCVRGQKEAVRSKRLYSKAREWYSKEGLFHKGSQESSPVLMHEGTIKVCLTHLETDYEGRCEVTQDGE